MLGVLSNGSAYDLTTVGLLWILVTAAAFLCMPLQLSAATVWYIPFTTHAKHMTNDK